MNGMWERRGSTQDGQGDSLKGLEELAVVARGTPGALALVTSVGRKGRRMTRGL